MLIFQGVIDVKRTYGWHFQKGIAVIISLYLVFEVDPRHVQQNGIISLQILIEIWETTLDGSEKIQTAPPFGCLKPRK